MLAAPARTIRLARAGELKAAHADPVSSLKLVGARVHNQQRLKIHFRPHFAPLLPSSSHFPPGARLASTDAKVPITLAYGDGIGPEITASTMAILDASGARIAPEVSRTRLWWRLNDETF
jgi:hypothetical protein